jgi:hypothetical protein
MSSLSITCFMQETQQPAQELEDLKAAPLFKV